MISLLSISLVHFSPSLSPVLFLYVTCETPYGEKFRKPREFKGNQKLSYDTRLNSVGSPPSACPPEGRNDIGVFIITTAIQSNLCEVNNIPGIISLIILLDRSQLHSMRQQPSHGDRRISTRVRTERNSGRTRVGFVARDLSIGSVKMCATLHPLLLKGIYKY